MKSRRLITSIALGAAIAGVIPASLAGATGTVPDTAGDDPYCAAHLALEAAIINEDPDDDQTVLEAAQAAASEEVAEALSVAAANVPDEGPPSAEYTEAWNVIIDYVRENCGYAEIDVLAKDYSYGGIGGEVAAGPTIINLINEGTEFHEMAVIRRNEGVTATVDEIIAMPEEESEAMTTFVGIVIAAPGTTASSVFDLTPGSYIGICFIPVGTTPEAVEAMLAAEGSAPPESAAAADGTAAEGTAADETAAEATAAEGTAAEGTAAEGTMPPGTAAADGTAAEGSAPEGEGEGPPHFTEGMVVEFTVVEGGTTDTGTMTDMSHTTVAGEDMTATTEAATETTAPG